MPSQWRMRIPLTLLVLHLGALIFGLIGMLVMLPHPELWQDDPRAVQVFDWSMSHAGATHIWFGAAAMFAYGCVAIGLRRTAIFAGVTYVLSLSSELIGTGTGWPFGNYEYTSFLGTKVLGRVPYTIPLSWFYMGFASYLLGLTLVQHTTWRRPMLWALVGGAWFLTAWDLVLDPAMAHPSLSIQFWTWHQTGAYFDMPLKNLIGWTVTGFVFMTVSRLAWRTVPDTGQMSLGIPMATYLANLGFAVVLSFSVGLWQPVVLAVLLGVIPALAVFRMRPLQLAPYRKLALDA